MRGIVRNEEYIMGLINVCIPVIMFSIIHRLRKCSIDGDSFTDYSYSFLIHWN